MTLLNSFTLKNQEASNFKTCVFCMKAFINHSRKHNVKVEYLSSSYAVIFATQDIKKGAELLYDYCLGLDDLKERNQIL